jgi:hypothetical protein
MLLLTLRFRKLAKVTALERIEKNSGWSTAANHAQVIYCEALRLQWEILTSRIGGQDAHNGLAACFEKLARQFTRP